MTNRTGPDGLMVGASVVEVPVPDGTMMAGFAARGEPSAGVNDPLTVRALVIEDVCWITVDVCGLDEATCRSIIDGTRFPFGRVVVSATHTHSGPGAMPARLGGCNAEVLTAICGAATRACSQATQNRRLCSVSYEAFSNIGIARNRRHPEIQIDPKLQVIVFKQANDSVVAWLVQYPCHPVVLGADNRFISGDYPAFLRRYLEENAPDSVALFLTGAAGDVNTGHSAESSYSQGGSPTRTFAEAERIGTHLARTGYTARNSPRILQPRLDIATATIDLELEILDAQSRSTLAAQWTKKMDGVCGGERELLRVWSNWALGQVENPGLTWTGTVTVVRVADLLLVALPGEPFLDCAGRIQEEFDVPVVVSGYSNGCPGYFPTAEEYDWGGYEILDAHRYYGMLAPFKRGSAEKLVETAVSLGRQLT